MFEGAELECIVPSPGTGIVRLGGYQVAPRDQFVAQDGGVVAKWPTDSRRRSWWSTGHKRLNGFPPLARDFALTARLVLPG